MTPADELTAAASLLQPLADAAQADLDADDFWKCYDPATAWRDGFLNGMGGKCGDLAGAIPPAAVTELVRWLRAEARRLSYVSRPDWQDVVSPHAVALARIILGRQS
jgi:hypothetical protein